MKPHTKIYLDFFSFGMDDFIPCERCGAKAVDIHHIIKQSKFGKKNHEKNKIGNLIALCRNCHDKAESNILISYTLLQIHDQKIKNK